MIQPVLFAAFVVISISMVITGAITSQTLKLYVLGYPILLGGRPDCYRRTRFGQSWRRSRFRRHGRLRSIIGIGGVKHD